MRDGIPNSTSMRRGHRASGRTVLLLLTGLLSACVPGHAVQAQTESAMRPETGNSYAAFVAEASQRFSVPAAWIRAVMRVESNGNQRAVSSAGAMGLMQIMPDTWADLRARYGLGHDPFDPHDNILAGAAFLHEMHDRYGSAGFLAAYNCGQACYDNHLATGRPLPPETVAYVTALLPLFDNPAAAMAALGPAPSVVPWTQAPLFARHFTGAVSVPQTLTTAPSDGGQTPVPVRELAAIALQSGGLFVALSGAERAP